MTSHDSGDDGDGDAQLKSLRAVWLSLPDEDPPERGLAELMAAARVKAEQMAKPSLWQRISALLRRPPVLALATVLVLIGGAVFIGQRKSKMEAPQTIDERARDNLGPGAGSAAMAPANTVAVPEGAPAGGQPAPAAEEVAVPAAPTAEPTPEPKKEVAQKLDAPPRTTHRAPANNAATKTATTSKPTDAAPPKTATTKASSDKETKKADTRGFDGTSELIEGDVDDKPSKDRFSSPPPAEAPAADVRVTGGATKGATTQPEVSRAAQYVAQAKSAAARGDCAAARTLMKRVASEDAASYRKALASDAALKKCFE